jgi:uncharacterized protein (UPF0305 family)
LRSDLTNF